MDPIDYKDIVYDIIGAAMTVHSILGWGLLEPLYSEALHYELLEQGIQNEKEKYIDCYYKEYKLDKYYKADLMVSDIVIELKSVTEIVPAHRAQLFNYLRLTKKPIGLLINFGTKSLHSERFAYFESSNKCCILDRDMNIVY